MRRIAVMAMCAVILLSLASFAQTAADDKVGSALDHSGKYMSMKDRLGLTDDQVAKLKSIRVDLVQKNKPLIEQSSALAKELRTLLQSDDPDLGAVESKIKDLNNVRMQVILNRISAAKEANKVLTPEQKEKLKGAREKQRSMMRGKMQQGTNTQKGK